MQEEFLFSGFGGQGVMFAGQLLAYTAMEVGLEVTWIPSYGPEMRGGTAHCYVVVSDRPIGSPIVSRPSAAIVFNIPSWDKYEPVVKPGGRLIVNASLVESRSARGDLTELRIPASTIADEIGSAKLTNMVLLGATLAGHPLITIAALQHALSEHIPAHRRDMLDMNFAAVERGASLVSSFA